MKKLSSLLCCLLMIGICSAQKQKSVLNKAEISPEIDALVQLYLDLDIFSGVVLLAEHGKPVYHKAFGLANRTTNTPNTLNTKFDIGSMNKTFTHVVILQLVEEGKLKLSNKLGQYLSGFPEEAANQITVEQLLHHRSGYGDYMSPDFFDQPVSKKNIAGLVERIKGLPLLFEPGTEQEYSNAGFILLGAIIEKITGKSYFENVRDRIIKPLGLKETYLVNKSEVPDRAIGYYKTMRGELLDNNGMMELTNPDGGFQSTTTDIMTFYREYHYGNKLLKEKTKMMDEMYKWTKTHAKTGGAIPHAGGFNGANTVFYEILRDDISLVIFANMDEPVAEQLGDGILAIIRGKEARSPSLPAAQNVYQAYNKEGIDYVRDNFDDLTVNFHPTDPKDLILNNIGYQFMEQNEVDRAIEFFELNCKMFPEVGNVWDSLGEAYLKKGDKAKALEYYKKALSINPGIPSAQEAVQALGG